MHANIADFAPYFRNGRLYLPQNTLTLLTDSGLETSIAAVASDGLDLHDHKNQIAIINKVLEKALAKLETSNPAVHALTSAEAKFLLTGKPASV